ncbi:MAG TPA: bestrophin family ion channel [Candidatus Acidoferrales bacterium]|nr:bestrophin family ion channel [Candidatus Acidoferrales bacterium]
MIVIKRAKPSGLIRYVGRPLLVLFAFDVAVAAAYVFAGWKWLALPDVPLSIFGGVLSVIVGFRNSSAYARWWEARTIWGGIVNHSRSFAREVLSMVAAAEAGPAAEREVGEMKHRLVLLQVAHVHALRNHLRGTSPWQELEGLIPEGEMELLKSQNNVPLAIQKLMAGMVARCYQSRWIDNIRWASLDRTLSNLMDCQGACERIKNTPMPRMYDIFIRHVVGIYCLLLPLGMVESLKLLTPVGSSLVGVIFLALDQIGRDLETPFENLPHDLPLTAITRTIEINLRQMIGEKDVPEPLAPVDGILW